MRRSRKRKALKNSPLLSQRSEWPRRLSCKGESARVPSFFVKQPVESSLAIRDVAVFVGSVKLAYCTNIHPAESWEETFAALRRYALAVRDEVQHDSPLLRPFPLAPRLSARAARELLRGDCLPRFRDWLVQENCEVFTINGFPYGAFHDVEVKKMVYAPDWTQQERLDYTLDLFRILVALLPPGAEGSVSTSPGSHRDFQPDPLRMFALLEQCAEGIEDLVQQHQGDLHLGMEPEPFGYFENTQESIDFFARFWENSSHPQRLRERIGINYDTCHFAIVFEDDLSSLQRLIAAGLRISKVHLSAALKVRAWPTDAVTLLQPYDEPTYLHQVMLRQHDGALLRFGDLPPFLQHAAGRDLGGAEARVHFHVPLDAELPAPLESTRDHAAAVLQWHAREPDGCRHFEIETYTWKVLPGALQRPLEQQLAAEYRWVLDQRAAAIISTFGRKW